MITFLVSFPPFFPQVQFSHRPSQNPSIHGWSDVWTDRTDKDWKWAPRPRHLWRHYIRTQFSYAKWFLMSYCLAFESLVVDQKKETCLFSSVSRFFFFVCAPHISPFFFLYLSLFLLLIQFLYVYNARLDALIVSSWVPFQQTPRH